MDNTELRRRIADLFTDIKGYYHADLNAWEARKRGMVRRIAKVGANNEKLKTIYHDLMEELYGEGGLKGY